MPDADSNQNAANDEQLFSTLLAESPQLWSVVEAFVRTLPDHVTAMRDAMRQQAFDRLQAMARQLQAAGIDHGCKAVADRASGIEQAAHDHVMDALAERLTELTQLIEKIQTSLQNQAEP
jgi:hypothetical protein